MEKVKVRDIMTRPLITEDENETVDKIAREMAELGIGSVVITRKGRPVGIITERDIALRVILKGKKANEVLAKEIMSTPLITIEPDATVEEACEMLVANKIKRLPVVERDIPLGIVSVRNVLTAHPEFVSRIYPKVKVLASGWTLDRLERKLSGCEVFPKDICIEKLKEVREELQKLASYYTEDEELIEIFKAVDELYNELEQKERGGEEEKEARLEKIREKFEAVLRKFRHATLWRKQHSISTSFSGTLWFTDYAADLRKTPQIPVKRIPTVFRKDEEV
ncbi:MAG: CBS domain-containing protein [Candidatus Methanospirare jalkutatii]|nr:CBS domain-containing protein [Candidatus Methanospirare jalkutatii]